jgi:hypothetical protein
VHYIGRVRFVCLVGALMNGLDSIGGSLDK